MSKSNTQSKSYMSLLGNTFTELFHPESKKALLNYKELDLINWDELKLLNLDEFKLLNTNELRLLDLGLLAVFFQYIGAFFLTLSFGFVLAFGMFSLHSQMNTFALAEAPADAVQETTAYTREERVEMLVPKVVEPQEVTINAEVNPSPSHEDNSFENLIASNAEPQTESKVLGATVSINDVPVANQVSPEKVGKCSFTVIEGETSMKFSSGAKLQASKVFEVCVDTNKGVNNFNWTLNGVDGATSSASNASDCITSYELLGAQSLDVTLVGNVGQVEASCTLNIE